MPTAVDDLNRRSPFSYGLSEGSPSEKGIRMDAQTSLDYITSHPYLSKTRIVSLVFVQILGHGDDHLDQILYGQSIGGAVAIDLVSRNPTTVSRVFLSN